MRPDNVNILGKTYKIEYVDRPSDVDMNKRESLWGQIDYWNRQIRVYDNGRNIEDLWHTIFHEVIHGVAVALQIKVLQDNEKDVDLLALALVDVMFRNEWVNFKKEEV